MLEKFLENLASRRDPAYEGYLHLFERIVDNQWGPACLTKEQSHEISKRDSIWQFSKGRWRVPWFHGGYYGEHKKLIVCLEGFLKKTQKTPKEVVEQAKTIKKAFEHARSSRALAIRGIR